MLICFLRHLLTPFFLQEHQALFSLDFRGFYPVGFCPRRLCLRGFCPRFLLVINKITKKENQLEFSFHRYWKIVAKVGIILLLQIVTRLCYYYVAAFFWLFWNILDFRGLLIQLDNIHQNHPRGYKNNCCHSSRKLWACMIERPRHCSSKTEVQI